MSFLGDLAKQGLDMYQKSQSPKPSSTGGDYLNSGDNTAKGAYSTHGTGADIDDDEVVRTASAKGSGDSSLFSSALSFLGQNKPKHEEPVDEDRVINAHKEVYEKGNASKVDANSMGAAAALQVLKQFTSSGSSSSDKASKSSGGGNTQTQLISLAMAEATKMFDKSGGAKQGDKQDAVNSAAMTIMKLLIQSKFSGGTTGGKDSGGLGSLVGMLLK